MEWSRVRLRALTGSDSVQMKSMIGSTLQISAVCWEIDKATSVCHGSAIAMGTIADWMSCRVDEV